MIHVARALLRKWIEALLHIHDSPQRTAAAFAVGVFWGFSPFFGLHTILGLIGAVLLAALAYLMALPAIVAGRTHLHLRTHAVASTESR
ncbi:MAG: DUF2062 domain-containing protein [Acidobacteria bacterium]|nr:DUF2062 domain-containing protein [Acidobacteriota bacterium]